MPTWGDFLCYNFKYNLYIFIKKLLMTEKKKKRPANRIKGWIAPELRITEIPVEEMKVDLDTTNRIDDLEDERYVMILRDRFPKPLLDELYKLMGCECIIEATSLFMHNTFSVSKEMQREINNLYRLVFKERVDPTACGTCLSRRINRLRLYLQSVGVE